jgi:hypothetical protein
LWLYWHAGGSKPEAAMGTAALHPPMPHGYARRMRLLAPSFLALALLAGCASTKEARVESALLDAGMPEPMAQCMAEPLGRDLSVQQLQSLQRVAKLAQTSPTKMTQQQVLNLLKRDLDPETVGVVVRAGVGCFVRG